MKQDAPLSIFTVLCSLYMLERHIFQKSGLPVRMRQIAPTVGHVFRVKLPRPAAARAQLPAKAYPSKLCELWRGPQADCPSL